MTGYTGYAETNTIPRFLICIVLGDIDTDRGDKGSVWQC